jgi:hypothetical protein
MKKFTEMTDQTNLEEQQNLLDVYISARQISESAIIAYYASADARRNVHLEELDRKLEKLWEDVK